MFWPHPSTVFPIVSPQSIVPGLLGDTTGKEENGVFILACPFRLFPILKLTLTQVPTVILLLFLLRIARRTQERCHLTQTVSEALSTLLHLWAVL